MTVNRIRLALAIASVAIVPITVSAQGGAPKGSSPKTTATAPAKSTADQAPAPAQQPAAQKAATATEQAKCKDGSMYSGTSRQGACSSHGGVAQWLTASKTASVPKGATARCGDGTYYSKAERKGACSGHKGVAEWLKKG